jgi:hypothetical protein
LGAKLLGEPFVTTGMANNFFYHIIYIQTVTNTFFLALDNSQIGSRQSVLTQLGGTQGVLATPALEPTLEEDEDIDWLHTDDTYQRVIPTGHASSTPSSVPPGSAHVQLFESVHSSYIRVIWVVLKFAVTYSSPLPQTHDVLFTPGMYGYMPSFYHQSYFFRLHMFSI